MSENGFDPYAGGSADADDQFDLDPTIDVDNTGPVSASPVKKGPFAVSSVDPLVYKNPGDSPELRPAAAYVQSGPRLTIRETPPPLPVKKEYAEWTPAGDSASGGQPPPTPVQPKELSPLVKNGLTLVAIILPLLLIIGAVVYGLSLYKAK